MIVNIIWFNSCWMMYKYNQKCENYSNQMNIYGHCTKTLNYLLLVFLVTVSKWFWSCFISKVCNITVLLLIIIITLVNTDIALYTATNTCNLINEFNIGFRLQYFYVVRILVLFRCFLFSVSEQIYQKWFNLFLTTLFNFIEIYHLFG